MIPCRWEDWSGAAEMAYQELASRRCDRVVVAGLSMGGTLTCWLAARHPEIAGIVCVNPAVEPPAESFMDIFQGSLDEGLETIPAIGNDVADPDSTELAYDATPVAAAQSLFHGHYRARAQAERDPLPGAAHDQPAGPRRAADEQRPAGGARVSGPVERVSLERSYHVATLDYDKAEIEARAVDFARKVTV